MMIFSDIGHKAKEGIIDLLPRTGDVQRLSPSLNLPELSMPKRRYFLRPRTTSLRDSKQISLQSSDPQSTDESTSGFEGQDSNGEKAEDNGPIRQSYKSSRVEKRVSRQRSNITVDLGNRLGESSNYTTSIDHTRWYCGHCRGGPMSTSHHLYCNFCYCSKDLYSSYETERIPSQTSKPEQN